MIKMLIVEDEDILRQWIATGIDYESIGYSIVGTAANGLEALQCLEKTPVDAIITDIRMPDMDGIELMDMLHHGHPEIEVIVLSGYNSFEYAHKAIQYGAFEFLTKPLDEDELKDTLQRLRQRIEQKNKAGREAMIDNISAGAISMDAVVRDAFLASLFIRPMDAAFLQMSLKQMGFAADAGMRRIAIIDVGLGGDDESEDAIELLQTILGQMRENLPDCPATVIDRHIALLWHPDAMADACGTLYRLRQIKDAIEAAIRERLPHAALTIAVSDPFKFPGGTADAYLRARALHAQAFFEGYGTVFDLESLHAPLKQEGNASEGLWKRLAILSHELVEAMVSHDVAQVSRLADLFFDTLLKDPGVTAATARLKLLELLMLVDSRLFERKIEIPLFKQKNLLYQIIQQRRTLVGLKHLFDSYAAQIRQQTLEQALDRDDKGSVAAKVRAFVSQNIDQKITLEDMARETYLSPSYLSTVFKKETGMTLVQCIHEMKLRRAQELLSTSDLRTQEVADRLGFSDYRYFCTIFKKMIGVPPQQFRNLSSWQHEYGWKKK